MSPLPLFFIATVLAGFALYAVAVRRSVTALALAVAWIAIQSALALRGFFLITSAVPPHLAEAIVPPLAVIALVFLTASGRRFLDAMDLRGMVLLHTIRIFVELNLFWLYLHQQVPRLLTFEGGNFDILIGLSAPLIWWLYSSGRVGRRGLLVWNSVAILGVLNAVVRALLSAPFPFQRFGFDQPTVAILHFPFILLPGFLVPIVLFCHLALFRRLTRPAS